MFRNVSVSVVPSDEFIINKLGANVQSPNRLFLRLEIGSKADQVVGLVV